jgi:hemerythrin-like domain-containing protein
MRATLRIIRDEHQAMAALLRTLLILLKQAREQQVRPDFSVLRAMLFYIAEFPEKRHHRKESDLLFPKLRARTPLSRTMLDRLDEDHLRGEAKIRELEHALTAFEFLGDDRRAEFESVAKRYVDFYLSHMALEEREILPLAQQVLSAEDWDELDLAMAREMDPLAGGQAEAAYRGLFDHITRVIPAPLGLGEPPPGRTTD